MKRWFRIVSICAALCAVACERDNPTFGPLPRIVCEALESPSATGPLPDPSATDRIYRSLLPHFGRLRGREVPFTMATEEYEVRSVKLAALRRSCDIEAEVTVGPLRPDAKERQRLYFLAEDADGIPFARGIAFAAFSDDGGERHAEATFHLTADAARYKDFSRMVFVPQERFNAAADAIRRH